MMRDCKTGRRRTPLRAYLADPSKSLDKSYRNTKMLEFIAFQGDVNERTTLAGAGRKGNHGATATGRRSLPAGTTLRAHAPAPAHRCRRSASIHG
jgi:hypothetical protein